MLLVGGGFPSTSLLARNHSGKPLKHSIQWKELIFLFLPLRLQATVASQEILTELKMAVKWWAFVSIFFPPSQLPDGGSEPLNLFQTHMLGGYNPQNFGGMSVSEALFQNKLINCWFAMRLLIQGRLIWSSSVVEHILALYWRLNDLIYLWSSVANQSILQVQCIIKVNICVWLKLELTRN